MRTLDSTLALPVISPSHSSQVHRPPCNHLLPYATYSDARIFPVLLAPRIPGEAAIVGVWASKVGVANDFLRFWEFLQFATQSDSGHTPNLPRGIRWLGDPAFSCDMCVRPCYEKIYVFITHSGSHRSIVLGAPGTDKSMFGLLVAWRHLQSSPTQPLIYRAQNGQLVSIVSVTAQHVEYKEVENLSLLLTAARFTSLMRTFPSRQCVGRCSFRWH
jgi:hypothetical protein